MIEVNERSILGIALVDGLEKAMNKFLLVNKVEFFPGTKDKIAIFYRDFEDLISDSKSLYYGEIEIFNLLPNTNLVLLDTFLSLIRKETYHLGLRIIRKDDVLYVFIDRVINKNSYYVETFDERQEIRNMIRTRK